MQLQCRVLKDDFNDVYYLMDMVKQVHSMLWARTATAPTVYRCTATKTVDVASACVHTPSELMMVMFVKRGCCRSVHATSN